MERNNGNVKRRSNTRKGGNKTKPDYIFLCWTFLATFLSTCATSYAVNCPNLQVKNIKVKGIHLADKDLVQRLANTATGENLIAFRKGTIVRRIAAISEVEQVKMGRSFPDAVWVRVEERTPFASLTTTKGYVLIQENGFAFHVSTKPAPRTSIIKLTKPVQVVVGSIIKDSRISNALDALRQAKLEDIAPEKIVIDQDEDMCLNMSGGFLVKLGQPYDIAGKLHRVRRALDCKPSLASDAAYIDVSCPGQMVMHTKRGDS